MERKEPAQAIITLTTDFGLQDAYVGSMKGVDRLEVQGPHVVVFFDDSATTREFIDKITRESIEKLGYRIESEP